MISPSHKNLIFQKIFPSHIRAKSKNLGSFLEPKPPPPTSKSFRSGQMKCLILIILECFVSMLILSVLKLLKTTDYLKFWNTVIWKQKWKFSFRKCQNRMFQQFRIVHKVSKWEINQNQPFPIKSFSEMNWDFPIKKCFADKFLTSSSLGRQKPFSPS